MQAAPPRQKDMLSRARRVAATGALALAATVCAGATMTIGGDNGRLPATAAAATPAPSTHPGEAAKRGAATTRIRTVRRSDDLAWPLHGEVTSGFGEPRGGRSHEGLDIPMPAGTPIRAAANGTVVMRESQSGYGKYTCIAHREITTCYGHQSRFRTKPGATVRRGETIGTVGNTGNSATVHLHFEVRRGTRPWGTPVDPAKHLPRGG
jgi:murein DD-endopeptidase MepM/ murein hydrolase activator NlpD